jgi:hypothetical protein
VGRSGDLLLSLARGDDDNRVQDVPGGLGRKGLWRAVRLGLPATR